MNTPPTTNLLLQNLIESNKERHEEEKVRAEKQLEEALRVSNRLNEQQGDITKILSYLEVNRHTGEEGLVKQVNRMEGQLERLEHKTDKKIWMFSTIVTGLVLALKWIFAKII